MIIDDKGRLFGKINIIDFLVVIFLLSLTPMFYFGYKIYNSQQAKSKKEYVNIMIECKFVRLTPGVLKMISVGDKELDINGNVVAEIVSLGRFTPYMHVFNIGPNRKLILERSELKQAKVTLKINAEVRGKNIYYNDNRIVEGGSLEFFPCRYSAEIEDLAIIQNDRNIVVDAPPEMK